MKLLSLIFLVLIGFVGGWFAHDAYNPLASEAQALIPAMEVARDAHQYYVDNPELIWWSDTFGKTDAEWVKIYDEVIDIIQVAIIEGG